MHSPANASNIEDTVLQVHGYTRIDGVVPGIKGQRAFPTVELRTLDPFVMLDHIGPEKLSKNFKVDGELHPHRGFETITFMLEGNMAHIDSIGTRAFLGSGSVQVMNAGKGISHGGDMSADKTSSRFHEVQLWVNSPAKFKMSEPEVNTFRPEDIPVKQFTNSTDGIMQIRVIAGKAFDEVGPAKTFADISALHIEASGRHNLVLPIPESHSSALLYVLEGESVTIGDNNIAPFNTAVFDRGLGSVEVAIENAQLLLLTGKPIGEPVVMSGPFVMNSQQEIDQAMLDYSQGLFD